MEQMKRALIILLKSAVVRDPLRDSKQFFIPRTCFEIQLNLETTLVKLFSFTLIWQELCLVLFYFLEDLRNASSAGPISETLISKGRAWGSEPSLIHESKNNNDAEYRDHDAKGATSSRANSAASVTFADDLLETTYNSSSYKSSKIYTRGVKKLVQRKEQKMEGGRYTLINKNFEPLKIEFPEEPFIDWEAFDKLKEFNYKNFNWKKSNSSNNSSGSTDSLLEEANNFLEIAKERFVTTEDWVEIKSKKSSKKSSVSNSVRDLEINDYVQFIGQDMKIHDGQVRNVMLEDELLHVAV